MRILIWRVRYVWVARKAFGYRAAWVFSAEWAAWLRDGETDYTPWEVAVEDVRCGY